MDVEWSAALTDRHYFNRVDVNMRRYAGHPINNFGDVDGSQGLGASVDRFGFCLIPVEADEGEFAFRQPRLNVGHPDVGMVRSVSEATKETSLF